MQELIDLTINHYHIERRLAHGGMSEVYFGRDIRTGDAVAIKVVRRSVGEYYERFRRETKVMKNLQHSHILPALDTGIYYDWAYMVTPFVSDGTLTTRLMRGALSVEEAGQLLDQIASALQFAHDNGILHRDIKSSNVLLRGSNYAYLTDFGLVKTMEDEFSLTKSGFMIGTPEYMAPELVDGSATPLSDIYALGVLMYQMLTGVLPFRGNNPVSIVMKHIQEKPFPPSKINPRIPPDVERVILQTLEKDPQRRFRTVRAFANAYRHAYNTELPPQIPAELQIPSSTINVVPGGKPQQPAQRSFFKRPVALIGGVLLILVVLVGAFLLLHH
jgi:serine/threonine protein kinase